tara:strand:- start:326 stop:853 length:528 start_codon:yes stop_codon:yes gene_type:complete
VQAAPQKWDRLVENSLRANALNSSVTDLKKTQGAANQTTRINCKPIGQAACVQAIAVQVVIAKAMHSLRQEGFVVATPHACNVVNMSGMCLLEEEDDLESTPFAVMSTTQLVPNTSPIKLSSVCVLDVATSLGAKEMECYYISNVMVSISHQAHLRCIHLFDTSIAINRGHIAKC